MQSPSARQSCIGAGPTRACNDAYTPGISYTHVRGEWEGASYLRLWKGDGEGVAARKTPMCSCLAKGESTWFALRICLNLDLYGLAYLVKIFLS